MRNRRPSRPSTVVCVTDVSPSDGSTCEMYSRNTGFGPTTSTPSRAEPLAVLVEQERGAVQTDRGLAGARTALHDEALSIGARMTTSCSAWIVATMSRIWPVRARRSSASSGSGTPPAAAASGVGIGEVLLEDVGELAAGEHEAAAAAQAERIGRGRAVERHRDAGPPVDDDGLALGVFDLAAADVEASPTSSSMRPKHSTATSSSSERSRWVRCQRTAAVSNSPAARSSWSTYAAVRARISARHFAAKAR